MKPNIIAIGSSPVITNEISHLWNTLVDGAFPIQQVLTSDIPYPDADIYICAPSQYELVKNIPNEKLYTVELVPTSSFFLQIGAIPKGSDIYLFNNQHTYIDSLIAYCQKLGLTDYQYIPIAFAEAPRDTIITKLTNAQYIIGVDKFIESELEEGLFSSYVKKDRISLLKAKRTLAFKDICKVLNAIANYYIQQDMSADEIQLITSQIRDITIQALASQADLRGSLDSTSIEQSNNPKDTLKKLQQLLQEISLEQ